MRDPEPGTRIELVYSNDPFTRLEPGTQGTVVRVDSAGTIHVAWETGSSLGLCPEDGDRWRELTRW